MIIQIQKTRMPEALRWMLEHDRTNALNVVNIQKGIELWEVYVQKYEGRLGHQTVDFELSSFSLPLDSMVLFKLTFAA